MWTGCVCVWWQLCIKLALFIKASDGKGGQSKVVREVAGGAGMCSGLSFSPRPATALGLTFKVKKTQSCKLSSCGVCAFVHLCVFVRPSVCAVWVCMRAGRLDEFVSFVVNAQRWFDYQRISWVWMDVHANHNLINQVMSLQWATQCCVTIKHCKITFHWHFSSLASSLTVCRYPQEIMQFLGLEAKRCCTST